MKITPKICSIPKERRTIINNHMRKFNESFTNNFDNCWAVTRNKLSIPFHSYYVIISALTSFHHFLDGNALTAMEWLLFAKINSDFIPFVNNINKRKALGFLKYMELNGITEEQEKIYGLKKYLFKAGSYYYPILYPNRVKEMAITGKSTRSFEPGIVALRTDGKSLLDKLYNKVRAKCIADGVSAPPNRRWYQGRILK